MKNLITILVANLLLLSCTAQKTPLELNPQFDPIRTSTLNERYEKALRDLAGMTNSAEKFAVDGFNYLEWAVDGKLIDPLKTAEAKEAFYAGLLADSLFPLNYVGLGQIELREGNGGKADTYFAKARSIVDNIFLDERIKDYIVNLVVATRDPGSVKVPVKDLIQYGASPRATIALTIASRAKAFLDGRGYVTPQDVKDVALDVLRHRIGLSYEAEALEKTSDDIVKMLLEHVPVP